MKQVLLSAVIVLAALNPAGAMSGSELREYCATRRDLCHGFIVGAAGMFWYQMEIINPICLGDDVTWEKIHDVVVNYLEENPEVGQEHALVLITWALRDAFDCPEAQKPRMGNEENDHDRRSGGAIGGLPSGP